MGYVGNVSDHKKFSQSSGRWTLVWHFPLWASYQVSRDSHCQVAQATLLKTPEDLKTGIPEIQQFCFVEQRGESK